MQRNASAARDADSYRPELIADEEPRYLRRQKPVEIRRKKFSGRGWPFYRRVLVVGIAGAIGATAAFYGAQFLQQFVQDRNRSVLRVPMEVRRGQLEQVPWVESASVQRILPNRLRIELTERTPVAFARNGNELALIDAHGVILDRPRGEHLHFPIVTGVSEDLPRDQREKRMQTYEEFMKDVDLVRGGSSDRVSEVDLSNPKDLRVVMTGLANASDSQAVTVHFGTSEFGGKYKMLIDNFSQWQANAGRVQSIDLQYSRQVVVNPDTGAGTAAARTK